MMMMMMAMMKFVFLTFPEFVFLVFPEFVFLVFPEFVLLVFPEQALFNWGQDLLEGLSGCLMVFVSWSTAITDPILFVFSPNKRYFHTERVQVSEGDRRLGLVAELNPFELITK